jgi:hypothetical protein
MKMQHSLRQPAAYDLGRLMSNVKVKVLGLKVTPM